MESHSKMMSLDVEYSFGKKLAPVSGEIDRAMEFSSKVMSLLTSKANEYNYVLENENEVTSEKLKQVFVNSYSESLQTTQALASVNLYLHTCSAGIVDDGEHFEPSMEEIKEANIQINQQLERTRCKLCNYPKSQVGIDSNSLPVREPITIAKNKLITIMIINNNNENISPFEKGLLLPNNC